MTHTRRRLALLSTATGVVVVGMAGLAAAAVSMVDAPKPHQTAEVPSGIELAADTTTTAAATTTTAAPSTSDDPATSVVIVTIAHSSGPGKFSDAAAPAKATSSFQSLGPVATTDDTKGQDSGNDCQDDANNVDDSDDDSHDSDDDNDHDNDHDNESDNDHDSHEVENDD